MSQQQQQQQRNIPIILVRHAERADKYEETKPLQEPHNPNLTREGFVQAVGAGKIINETSSGITWHVYSSPFMRAIQTAVGIMSQVRHAGLVNVDFELGEHIVDNSCIPDTTKTLTSEAATEITRKMGELAKVAAPLAKISYGDGSLIVPDSLAESGTRLMKAICRVYNTHVEMMTSGDKEQEAASAGKTGIIVVSHGFGPKQIMREVHGEEVDVKRVHLCAQVGLVPNPNFQLDDNSSPLYPVKKMSAFTAAAATSKKTRDDAPTAGGSASSPLLVSFTRGVKWRKGETTNMGGNDPVVPPEVHRDAADHTYYEPHHLVKDAEKHFLSYDKNVDLPPK